MHGESAPRLTSMHTRDEHDRIPLLRLHRLARTRPSGRSARAGRLVWHALLQARVVELDRLPHPEPMARWPQPIQERIQLAQPRIGHQITQRRERLPEALVVSEATFVPKFLRAVVNAVANPH